MTDRGTANDLSATGTLGKAMRLLDLVAEADHPLRFTDILALCGEPRGTVHRQLGHLVEEGLLETGADGCYRPGLRLLRLAARSWARNDLRTVAAPFLERLHAQTGETVHLGMIRDSEVIYLDKVESRQSVRMYSQIGRASPLHCTGIGKAALSALPQAQAQQMIRSLRLERFTMHTIDDPDMLEREIVTIRSRGYALDREEHEEGIRCVAAPLLLAGAGQVGGVSVTGPAYRLSEAQLEGWAQSVQDTAAAISRESEYRLGPHARHG